MYYYRDQHSLHNDSLDTEHEPYTTAYSSSTAQKQHTSNSNKKTHTPTTFHNPTKSNHMANTLSTLNPSEFEAKANKSFGKSYSKSTKSLNKNKFYDGDDDDYKVDNEFCDDDILTSHYYHNNKKNDDNRKGKKSKR